MEKTIENQKNTKKKDVYVVCPREQVANLGKFVEKDFSGVGLVYTL